MIRKRLGVLQNYGGIWSSYVSASPYAEGVDFEEAVDSAIELARLSELDDLD